MSGLRAPDERGPRFLVDAHLGPLAKTLRMLGYDALLARNEDDDTLVRLALAEDRLLLTRDLALTRRRVATRGPLRALYLHGASVHAQLTEVVQALGLSTHVEARFNRCLVCNTPLAPLPHEDAASRVPPYVHAAHREFHTCPGCGRVFWRGTHWDRMARELAAALGEDRVLL
jgi:uncharacterized protein with PIN domain